MSRQLWNQALDLHFRGDFLAAWQVYQRLAQTETAYSEYWLCLALLAWQTGHKSEASSCLQTALKIWSGGITLWSKISADLMPVLLDCLLEARLDLPFAHLMPVLVDLEPRLEHQLRLRLWRFFLKQGLRTDEDLCAACRRDQNWIEGQHLLAKLFLQAGKLQAALQIWQQIRDQHPAFLPAQIALGHLALQRGDHDGALRTYLGVLSQNPEQAEVHYQVGRLYLSLLNMDQARKHLQAATRLAPERKLWQIQQKMAYLPVVFEAEQSQKELARLSEQALQLRQSVALETCLQDISRGGIEPLFDLNYLGLSETALRHDFADIFVLPDFPRWSGRSRSQLSLGVVLTPGHEGLFLFGNSGVLGGLAQAGVDLVVFCWPSSQTLLCVWAESVGIDLVVVGPEVQQAISTIQKRACEIIYFWESGTDPINYFMPFFQLAPIQCTGWGSVATTGNPRMNGFLSTETLDPPGNEAHYRERLIRLPVLPMLYTSEMIVPSRLKRNDLGLPEGLLIGSPHNPMKYSRGYLEAIRAILEQLPQAYLVMIESRHPAWTEALYPYIKKVLGAQCSQLIWLKRLPGPDFLALCTMLDLVLDPFPFGAGKLTFECLGLGIPMLTLPSRYLRGRIVFAAYAQMGYDRLIALSPGDYVQKAVDVLKDPLALGAHKEVIQVLKPHLMAHPEVVPGLLAALMHLRTSPRRSL